MNCSACGTASRSGAKFCHECGAPLEQPCPSCGAAVTAGQKFCAECGSRLPAAEPARAESARFAAPSGYTPAHLAERILKDRAALTGERKQVTVLFADVSGFTRLAERLDPEDVHALMNRALELMLAEIHRYEGTVNQFLGDGLMALFGAPVVALATLSRAYSLSGRHDDAIAAGRESIKLKDDAGAPVTRSDHVGAVAEAYLAAGRPDEAEAAAREALEWAERLEERCYAGSSHWLLGEVSRRRGDRQAAARNYHAGLAIADELGAKPLADRCRAALLALG